MNRESISDVSSVFFGVMWLTLLLARQARAQALHRSISGRVLRRVQTHNTRAGFWTLTSLCAALVGIWLVLLLALPTWDDAGMLAMITAFTLEVGLTFYRPRFLEVRENGLLWHQFYSWENIEMIARRDCHGLAFRHGADEVCIEMSAADAAEIVSLARDRPAGGK